uniref:Mannosidase endo-alpha like n=1 Tax=Ursus americanus TaxID=9643 RepID=A0A452RG25_URSAM
MARRRRRACIALFLVLLFAFGTSWACLAPFERRPEGAPAPAAGPRLPRRAPPPPPPPRTAGPGSPPGPAPREAEPVPGQSLRVYSDLHAFYYSWYGSPRARATTFIGTTSWCRTGTQDLGQLPPRRHSPPDDLGSSFYPELGPYSSRDPDVRFGGNASLLYVSGVLVLSWYPPGMADDNGEPSDDLVPAILDTAHQYNIQVAFHIQPYKGRDDILCMTTSSTSLTRKAAVGPDFDGDQNGAGTDLEGKVKRPQGSMPVLSQLLHRNTVLAWSAATWV